MIRYLNRRRALLARLDRCRVRYLRLAADHDRERTLNNDLLAEVQDLTAQRDQARAIAVDFEQGLAARTELITGLRVTIAARLEAAQCAGAEYDVRIAALTADRDRALAQAETARAAAEAADIPVVGGLDPAEYVAAVKAVLADITARKKAKAANPPCAMCRAATIGDLYADVLPDGRWLCGGCYGEVMSA